MPGRPYKRVFRPWIVGRCRFAGCTRPLVTGGIRVKRAVWKPGVAGRCEGGGRYTEILFGEWRRLKRVRELSVQTELFACGRDSPGELLGTRPLQETGQVLGVDRI